jgi:NAD-dependent deacetylase
MATAPPIDLDAALIDALRAAPFVVALTGAGISAESGLATFRDAMDGLWARFDPRDLATPTAFARNPKLVWDWYAWRRERISMAQPNRGHFALAELERRAPRFLLVTQNVDGLHQRAGSRQLIELHGNIGRAKCSREGTVVGQWEAVAGAVPTCANCGAPLRPDVVWFGEPLPEVSLAAAEDAMHRCNVLLVVGTSAEVYPAAALPEMARQSGAIVVEINPNATALSAAANYVLRGAAGDVLPALLATLD